MGKVFSRDVNGENALHRACRDGDTVYVDRLLKKRYCDVNLLTTNSQSALHLASIQGHDKVVKQLLNKPECDTNLQNRFKESALHLATRFGHFKSVEQLLSSPKCNVKLLNRNQETALHLATERGNIEIVEQLLSRPECDVNVLNGNKDSALHLASWFGYETITKQLLSQPECDVNLLDKENESALHLATEREHDNIVEKLLNKPECDVNLLNKENESALHLATRFGNGMLVQQLLSKTECDVNLLNNEKESALHLATLCGHDRIVEYLLSKPECDVNSLNNEEETALHLATERGNIQIVEQLLGKPACDVNVLNRNKESALQLASWFGHDKIVELLLIKPECDVNVLNRDKESALHLAVERGHDKITQMLLSKPECDVNLLNRYNESALHFALKFGHDKIAEQLLKNVTCDINVSNKAGENALLLACKKRQYGILGQLLIDKRCDLALINTNNNTGFMAVAHYCADLDITVEETIERLLVEKLKCINTTDSVLNHQNKRGDTLLHIACEVGLYQLQECLFSEGKCNTSLQNNRSETFFHKLVEHVAACSDSEFPYVLNRFGAVLQSSNVMFGSEFESTPTALLLYLRKGNDRHEFDTPSHFMKRLGLFLNHKELGNLRPDTFAHAVNKNSLAICESLLKANADVNSKIQGLEPALHCAIRLNSVRKVQLIMKNGADLSIKWRGRNALEFAISISASEQILTQLASKMTKDEILQSISKCCAVGETVLTCSARLGVQQWLNLLGDLHSWDEKDGTGLSVNEIVCKRSRKLQAKTKEEDRMKKWYDSQKSTSVTITPLEKRQYKSVAVFKTVENCRTHFTRSETNEVQSLTVEVLNKVSAHIQHTSEHLAFDVELAGSMAEHTKCYFPNEIDLLCVFKHTKDLDFQHTIGNYFRIKVEPGSKWSDLCAAGLLEQGKVASATYSEIECALTKLISQGTKFGKLHLFKYSLLLRDKISGLQLLFRGDVFKDMVIHVDLVPSFKLPASVCFEPMEQLPLDTKCEEYYLIAKKSRHEDDITDCEFRVTTSVGERAVINKLKKNARNGFIFAKAVRLAGICGGFKYIMREPVRTEDYLTSHLLKNVLFSILLKNEENKEKTLKNAYRWALRIFQRLEQDLRNRAVPAWNYKTSGYLLDCRDCEAREYANRSLEACCQRRKLMYHMTQQIIFWLVVNKQEIKRTFTSWPEELLARV